MSLLSLPFVPLVPLLGAVGIALVGRCGRNVCAWAAALVTAASLALLLPLAPAIFASGAVQLAGWRWLPDLGLNLTFRLDGLALLFCLLITGIGLLVILYARYYLSERDDLCRLYALLLAFMGAMLGVVLSDNLLLLLVFWELTSLCSFLLVGYWGQRVDARQGARLALTITAGGGLALLAGLLLLGHIVGSFELSTVLAAGDQVRSHPLYPATLVLILLGVFTKSAQFPFHFWLPQAMAAPTPVSAYLHSATMVKAGVFLLARLYPALSGTDLWLILVGGVGLLTLLFGAFTALFQHDLKGLLAYSTISHLGLITLLFGLETPLATVAGVFHIINHAVFKASLFMAAGIIDHETGSRDMRKVNGLFRYMPQTAVLAMVAASAMAGVPLLNGFLSKEMFFGEAVHFAGMGDTGLLWPVIATIAGMFSVAYSVRFIHDVFFNGEPIDLPHMPPHEPPRYMRVPVEILVALCLLVGIVPAYTVGPLLAVAAASVVMGPLPSYSLAIWHGFNLPLLMSALAFVGGILIYIQRRWLFWLYDRYAGPNGKILFDHGLRWGIALAGRVTAGLESGSLQHYLALLIGAALVAGGLGFWGGVWQGDRPIQPLDPLSGLAALTLALAAALTVLRQGQRLTTLTLLGMVGLFVVLAFVRFSAPDLALTQLTVEVVTTILLLLALRYLPAHGTPEVGTGRRWRDGGLALMAGGGLAALAWGVLTRPPQTALADYFLATSLPEGGGANVVNVILVDFRGFDTLGEATVLAIAALGIVALLAGGRPAPETPWSAATGADAQAPLLLRIGARPILALTLLLAAYIFFRGHQLPGGGFIAGLVTALALVTQYFASDFRRAMQQLALGYRRMVAAGLALIAVTGAASGIFGHSFLTSTFTHVRLPLIGDFEIASAMAFDLGVYLIVVGTVMLILLELGQPEAEPVGSG